MKRIPVFRCHFDLCWWTDGCRRELERDVASETTRVSAGSPARLQSAVVWLRCLSHPETLSVSLCLPGPPWPVHAHTCATRGHGRSPTPLWCSTMSQDEKRGEFSAVFPPPHLDVRVCLKDARKLYCSRRKKSILFWNIHLARFYF